MIVDQFPDRTINVEGVEYLYFGGTNYLGMSTNLDFQNIVFENIKKWGTSYGSSRNSNIQLAIYETAEKLLATKLGTEAALTVTSGMLAGKLVIEYFSQTTCLFHFPATHPALMDSNSHPIVINGQLNPKIFKPDISKITILTDSIPGFCVEPIDLKIILEIPKEIEIYLVIDESHSLGIYSMESLNQLQKENIKIIKIASLGKALGLSGGVIAADSKIISKIRNQKSCIGASGMNPAYLNTYFDAQELYRKQKLKLEQNLAYLETNFKIPTTFTYNSKYPVIYFEKESISSLLFKNNIITTSFDYTSTRKLHRIVITANHSILDLERLVSVLNSEK